MVTKHFGFLTVSLVGIFLCGSVVGFWLLSIKEVRGFDLSTLSDFDQAQYYFNHGSDGEYDLDKARHYYTKVILNESGDVTAAEKQMTLYQLGRIDFLEGKFNAAIYKFYRLISLFNDSMPSAHYMLGLTYGYKAKTYGQDEDWQMAEEEFITFLDGKPDSPWAKTDLAWIYFAQGKYDEMLSVLEEGLETEPDSPWLLNMYGLALLNTGDKQKAEDMFIKAKENASLLTTADWGRAYPGNDSRTWADNLETFRSVIDRNLELSRQ